MAETARAMMVEKRILIDFGFLGFYLVYILYIWSGSGSIKRMNTLRSSANSECKKRLWVGG